MYYDGRHLVPDFPADQEMRVLARQEAAGAMSRALRRNGLLILGLVLLFSLWLWRPGLAPRYPEMVDWPTIFSLAGLLVLSTGLKESRFFDHLARRLLPRLRSERDLALVLVGGSALLAMFLTNDITLFIVVPFTLALARGRDPVKLMVFEALAVNVGSTLTPIGNPQNIFLWHRGGASFLSFMRAMLPLELVMLLCLFGFTLWAFRPLPLQSRDPEPGRPVRRRLLAVSALAFVCYLPALELGRAGPGLLLILVLYLVLFPRVLLAVDWALLVLFMVMFVDLHLLAETAWLRGILASLDPVRPGVLYFTGVGASQLLSNLPAALLLAKFTPHWQVLAWAVNLGGAGLALGSLANLIALRLAGERKAWRSFHRYSIPFLLITTGAAWFILP